MIDKEIWRYHQSQNMIRVTHYSELDGIQAFNTQSQVAEISCHELHHWRPRWFIDRAEGHDDRFRPYIAGLHANRYVSPEDIRTLRKHNLLNESQIVAAIDAILKGIIK